MDRERMKQLQLLMDNAAKRHVRVAASHCTEC